MDYDNSPGWLEVVVGCQLVSPSVGGSVSQPINRFGRSARSIIVRSVGRPVDGAVSRSVGLSARR